MAEPITTNKSLIVPNTGDLTGAWGTSALNPNFQTIDAMFGGVTTISLSSATTLLLSVPATTGVWPGSLSQSVNALIKFTGAQSGNAVVQFTLPGYYIISNQCTGTSYVQLSPTGAGNKIGAPPGQKVHVFFDGTDLDYVNMPSPGAALDLHTNTTSLPPWMQACTVAPYLLKNGATYSSSVYPALAQLLGSTYGGNGATTFGVPDESARFRLAYDLTGSGRVSSAGSGINATIFNASGGSQFMPGHSHTATVTDPGHNHNIGGAGQSPVYGSGSGFSGGGSFGSSQAFTILSGTTGISVAVNATGSGLSANMPPTIVSFIPLIKT